MVILFIVLKVGRWEIALFAFSLSKLRKWQPICNAPACCYPCQFPMDQWFWCQCSHSLFVCVIRLNIIGYLYISCFKKKSLSWLILCLVVVGLWVIANLCLDRFRWSRIYAGYIFLHFKSAQDKLAAYFFHTLLYLGRASAIISRHTWDNNLQSAPSAPICKLGTLLCHCIEKRYVFVFFFPRLCGFCIYTTHRIT